MVDWAVMILAGGRGRRLGGRVKALLPIGGITVIERQRSMLATMGVEPCLVTAPQDGALSSIGLPLVEDDVEAGAIGGLYTALHRAPLDPVVVLAGDMPFVSARLVQAMVERLASHDAVIPRGPEGWHPLCAVYRRRVARHLLTCIDARAWRVTDALSGLDVRAMTVDDIRAAGESPAVLLNVNTPDDLRRAERHAADSAVEPRPS